MRALAAVLAAALLLSLLSGLWIRVSISQNAGNAAETYLAGETEYVNASGFERFVEQLRSLRRPADLEDYYRRASARIALEDYEEALAYIDECLALYTADYGEELHADLLIKRGCLLTMLDRGDEAVAPLEQALEIDPAQSDVYLVLAQVYSAQGDAEALTGALTAYLALEPQQGDIRLLLAQLYYAAGAYAAAADEAQRLLDEGEDGPELTSLSAGIGLALIGEGDYERALALLDGAIALHEAGADEAQDAADADEPADTAQPETPSEADMDALYYYRGLCRLTLEQFDAAAEDYTRAIERGVSPQLSHYGRGVAELMRPAPDYEQAAEDLLFAANYEGDDADTETSAQALALLELLTAEE